MAANIKKLEELQAEIDKISNPFQKAALAGQALDLVIDELRDQSREINLLKGMLNGIAG